MARDRRASFGLLAIGVGAALLVALAPAEAAKPAKGGKRPHVRLGIVQSLFRDLPEPLMQIIMRPFKALMEAQTGVDSELVNGGDALALGKKLDGNDVQLGIMHGFEFAWARQQHPELTPLIIAVNKDPYLRAHVLVRVDDPAKGVGDLKGKIVSLPRMTREPCRLFFERRCTQPGVATDKHYARVDNSLEIEEALDALVDGKVQAVVVEHAVIGAYQKLKPGRASQLRTLQESEPFPCAVVVYKDGQFSGELVERFREGMIKANTTAKGRGMLQLCRITRFAEIPEDYEEQLEAVLTAYPPALAAVDTAKTME